MREMYPEYKLRPVEDVIELCARCKASLVYILSGQNTPWCRGCGDNERGIMYVRADLIREAFQSNLESDWDDVSEKLKALGVLL